MHFAALSLVGESVTDSGRIWRVNVTGALNLIEAAVAAGCGPSSSPRPAPPMATRRGGSGRGDAAAPIQRLWRLEAAIEQMLENFRASHGLRSVIFRYFNVAGADPEGEVGEQHRPETHLIPLMLDAIAGRRPALTVYGSDYDTPDGTCIRDYVHVMDLAEAHVLGLRRLLEGGEGGVFLSGDGHRLFGARGHRACGDGHEPRGADHRGATSARGCGAAGLRLGAGEVRTGWESHTARPCRR